MRRMLRHVVLIAIGLSIGLVFPVASGDAKSKEVALGEQTASKRRQMLVWNVNRTIVGFKVEMRAGSGIVNTVQFFRDGRKTREFAFGARMAAGQNIVKTLDQAVNVQQIKVSTDANRGAKYRLVVFESGDGGPAPSGTTQSGKIDLGTVRPTQRRQMLTFNVNRRITGYLVEVKSGRGIINTIQCTGPRPRIEHRYARYYSAGEKIERRLPSPTNVVQLRVSTDANKNTEYHVVVYAVKE